MNLKNIETDLGDRVYPMKVESILTNRQMNNNNEPVFNFNLKNIKTLNVNNNNVFRKPMGKSNEHGHTKNVNSLPVNTVSQLNCKNVMQETSSPVKMASQISSLNNNLTTNYTDNAKDMLTIKTSSLEGESIIPSPSNFKFLFNTLKTISSKITPTNSNKICYNFNDENIKILDYGEENQMILISIQQFGRMIKLHSNFNLNDLIEENTIRLNHLNELLKSMNFIYKKEEASKVDLKKPLHSTKNCKKGSYYLQKFVINQDNNVNTNKITGPNKLKKGTVSKLFSPVAAKSGKINFDLKLPIKNIPDIHNNISLGSSQNPSESKISSAKTRERIINEIYTNSDFRIKKYNIFLDFIGLNINDIKDIIFSQNKIEPMSQNCLNDSISKNIHLGKIVVELNTHEKKITPTSNEIEKLAKEINEDKSLIFSSISILNSTLKKARLEDMTSNKIIEFSKNLTQLYNSQKVDLCDFNESDIQEYDAYEYLRSPRYNNFTNHVNTKKIIIKRNEKKNNNLIGNLSRSFIISSINSDFYKYFVDDSCNNIQANTISNEMSVMKGHGSGMCEGLEQSAIYKKNHSRKFSEDLEKTIENIQRM